MLCVCMQCVCMRVMCACVRRDVFLIEQPWAGMKLFGGVPSADEVVSSVVEVCVCARVPLCVAICTLYVCVCVRC